MGMEVNSNFVLRQAEPDLRKRKKDADASGNFIYWEFSF